MSTDQISIPIKPPRGIETEPTDKVVFGHEVEPAGEVSLGPGRRRLAEFLARFGNRTVISSVGVSFAIYFLTAVQGILLARLLGPTGRGEWSTIVGYGWVLAFVGLLGTQLSIARRAGREPERRAELSRAALRTGALTGLSTVTLITLLSLWGLPADKSYLAPLCIACAFMFPSENMRLSLMAVDHGSGQFKRYNMVRLVAAGMFPALLLVLWLTGLVSIRAAVALIVFGSFASLIFCKQLQRLSLFGPASPAPWALVKEGIPFALGQLAADSLNRMDSLLMLWLASFVVQGYYAAAIPAAGLLMIGPTTVALFTFNAGVRHAAPLRPRTLAASVAAVVACQSLTCLIYAAIIGPLLIFVYGRDFQGAVPFALALLPVYGLNGCALIAEGYLQGRGKSMLGVRSRLVGVVVMLISVYLLWGRWKEMSVPLGAAVGQAVNALLIVYAVALESTAPAKTGAAISTDG